MRKSIISDERQCVVCGDTRDLHRHHIFYGTGNRTVSELMGCWCYLCPRHHNMSDHGVHADNLLDLKLKKQAQEILEKDKGWSREKFISMFGRSYL